jgi:hypothetical protein
MARRTRVQHGRQRRAAGQRQVLRHDHDGPGAVVGVHQRQPYACAGFGYEKRLRGCGNGWGAFAWRAARWCGRCWWESVRRADARDRRHARVRAHVGEETRARRAPSTTTDVSRGSTRMAAAGSRSRAATSAAVTGEASSVPPAKALVSPWGGERRL